MLGGRVGEPSLTLGTTHATPCGGSIAISRTFRRCLPPFCIFDMFVASPSEHVGRCSTVDLRGADQPADDGHHPHTGDEPTDVCPPGDPLRLSSLQGLMPGHQLSEKPNAQDDHLPTPRLEYPPAPPLHQPVQHLPQPHPRHPPSRHIPQPAYQQPPPPQQPDPKPPFAPALETP